MGGEKSAISPKKREHFAHSPLHDHLAIFERDPELDVSRAFEAFYNFFEVIHYELREKCVYL